jgi:hypothetical protein
VTHRIAVTFTLSDEDWARIQEAGMVQRCDPTTWFRHAMRWKAAGWLLSLGQDLPTEQWLKLLVWLRARHPEEDRTAEYAALTIEKAKADFRRHGYHI